MHKNYFWHESLNSEVRPTIGYCFKLCFVHSPFRSWLTQFWYVTTSGICTVLLAHDRSEDIEMFGDKLKFCIIWFLLYKYIEVKCRGENNLTLFSLHEHFDA